MALSSRLARTPATTSETQVQILLGQSCILIIMVCEKCGKEHDASYGSGRFCSEHCARARTFSEESKRKKCEKSKQAWARGSYKEVSLKGHHFTSKDWQKALLIQKEKREARNKELIKSGKYELLSRNTRRKLLLEEANYTCEKCGNSKWLNEPIWLEIHHIDDDSKNNKKENLMVVCLNCHAVLDKDYRFSNRKHNYS